MLKKEVLFLLVALILLSGCVQTSQETNPFTSWSLTFPLYYSEINEDYIELINTALNTKNPEDCQNIMQVPLSPEKINAYRQCTEVITKQNAFEKRDYELCQELYSSKDTLTYEECTAPIISYTSIKLNDPTLCQQHLTAQRLIDLCEEDYETYN